MKTSFIRGIFSEGTPESSKRLFGAIGFIVAIVFIALWKRELISDLLYVSASLIGLSALVSPFVKPTETKPVEPVKGPETPQQ